MWFNRMISNKKKDLSESAAERVCHESHAQCQQPMLALTWQIMPLSLSLFSLFDWSLFLAHEMSPFKSDFVWRIYAEIDTCGRLQFAHEDCRLLRFISLRGIPTGVQQSEALCSVKGATKRPEHILFWLPCHITLFVILNLCGYAWIGS